MEGYDMEFGFFSSDNCVYSSNNQSSPLHGGMSSRRRDRSRSPRSRLRMDSYSAKTGRSKVSPPRSREIDSVMKRARRSDSQSTYWNKKLLEAEEKDPNRWRHSGYKELYHHTGSSRSNSESGSRSKSRSRSGSASKSSSPKRGRSKSSVRSPRSPRRNSRARSPRKARSPRSPRKDSRGRSPRDFRARSPRRDSRGRSPRNSRARSPRRDSTLRAVRRESRGRSPRRSRSLVLRARSPRPRTPRSPRSRSPRVRRRTPPRQVRQASHRPRGRSAESNSSDTSSSCSDESCSVCSPKRKSSKERPRPKEPPPPERKREVIHYRPPPFIERSRSRSFSVPRSKPPVEKVKTKKAKKAAEKSVVKVNRAYIKREKHDSDSESSSGRGSTVDIVSSMAGPKLSLSERFGRMAQWSVDRDLEHRNLRITSGDRLTVEMDSPPSPLYPPSLSSIAEMGGSWDDVRVRYTYYKERGYLRDLTLSDYIKWEQWWYKYQDWLDADRGAGYPPPRRSYR